MTLAAILNKEFQPVLDLRIGFEKLVHLIYYAYLWQPLQFWNLQPLDKYKDLKLI